MGERNYKYLLKVAIDFGSTNTVMAWRVYDVGENGELVLSEKLNPINPIKRIPSMMIFKDENPDNEMVTKDLYGSGAEAVLHDSNTPPVVCDNFKQYLYTAGADREEYKKGIALCGRFFVFLREEYRQEIYNKLPGHVLQELKVVLYLSTPVRANPTHRTLMKTMAVEAGFTPENGITEISTEYDEARCIVRYAMERRKDDMKGVLEKASQPGGALLLFVDVGGSTTDINLQRILIDGEGNQIMDAISSWPNADVTYPLGGCQVDLAIRDYMIRKGYANRDYVLEKWEHGDGKFRFRRFKEDNNQKLEKGLQIDNLGMVRTVCYDYDEDIVPKVNYKNGEKINREIYEKEICREYIDHFSSAIRELFAGQRKLEGLSAVTPGDVDAIFLAGDGSRLYFIQAALMGHLGSDPGFARVKANPKQLFANWEDPSHCCALGALAELEKMVSYDYSQDKYYVQISIYAHDLYDLRKKVEENPNLLDPAVHSYKLDDEKAATCDCVHNEMYPLFEKNVQLPAEMYFNQKIEYLDTGMVNFIIQLQLFRVKDSGEKQPLAVPFAVMEGRTLARILMEGLRNIFRALLGMKDVEPVKATMNLNFMCKFTEEKQLQIQFEIKSDFFTLSNQSFQIDM